MHCALLTGTTGAALAQVGSAKDAATPGTERHKKEMRKATEHVTLDSLSSGSAASSMGSSGAKGTTSSGKVTTREAEKERERSR